MTQALPKVNTKRQRIVVFTQGKDDTVMATGIFLKSPLSLTVNILVNQLQVTVLQMATGEW